MAYPLLNHIHGKNGSRWVEFLRNVGIDNILLVVIDAAKYTHKAMFCTFYGEILIQPFEFDASMTGFKKVQELINTERKHHDWKQVVVGIETTGHYYEDLVRRCQSEGYEVRTINAASTAEERKAMLNHSKTDNIDLMAIVQTVIHGRGTSSELSKGTYQTLRTFTRARRELVQERTSIQNQILTYVDYIFREFQGKTVWKGGKRKRVTPFSYLFGKAPRYLMRHCLHPTDILSMGEKGLRELSVRENLKLRDRTIQLLLDFAEHSISQSKDCVAAQQFLLNQKLDQLEVLDQHIKKLEKKIEDVLMQTAGAVILSVPGIGVVSGAELVAEMGNISDFDHSNQLIKMAGTNPVVKQSGDRSPSYYRVSKQGRKSFRNIVYQVGKSLAVNNPEMKIKYQDLIGRGKHSRQAYIALGNRMIRLAFSMIKHQTLYRTEHSEYVLFNEVNKKLHKANVKTFFEKFVVNEHQSA